MTFSINDIPSLEGKVAIVTGANTGIGKETALELARKGAHVILACRSKDRTMPTIEEIIKETGNDKVEFMELDLLSLQGTLDFANAFLAKSLPLHILINNAGIMMPSTFNPSKDGIESQFATNHLGHFLLTMKLLPVLEKSAPSRIVCVSSKAHELATSGIPLADINKKELYNSTLWYAYSKLANILFARELVRKMKAKNAKVYVNTLHPGIIDSDLYRQLGWFLNVLAWPIKKLFFLTVQQGALTQLYLATHPDVEKEELQGEYYVPIALKYQTISSGDSKEAAKELWDYSVKVISEKLGPNVF